MQLENSLSFLNFDLSGSVHSAMIPVASLKSMPERLVNVKGFVAEIMAANNNNNNQNNYGSNYSHTTFFVKVGDSHRPAVPPRQSCR